MSLLGVLVTIRNNQFMGAMSDDTFMRKPWKQTWTNPCCGYPVRQERFIRRYLWIASIYRIQLVHRKRIPRAVTIRQKLIGHNDSRNSEFVSDFKGLSG